MLKVTDRIRALLRRRERQLNPRIPTRVRAGMGFCALLVVALFANASSIAADAPDAIVQRSRDTYAALRSYSDHGVVIEQLSPSVRERHTFSMSFNRVPRHFIFDFHKEGGEQLVVWGDPDAFHSWWQATSATTDYPNPNNISAINLNDFPTKGAITKIPALLYSKAPLIGALTNFAAERLDGEEVLAGHPCFRITGRTSDMYGSGAEVNVRKVTLWIDKSSSLIRQIRELTAEGAATITTYEPAANPVLADRVFVFKPPAAREQ